MGGSGGGMEQRVAAAERPQGCSGVVHRRRESERRGEKMLEVMAVDKLLLLRRGIRKC